MKTYNPMFKIAVKPVEHVTSEQFETALQQYSEALQNETQLQAAQEAALEEIRKKYAPELTCLEYLRKSAYNMIETYCREQKKDLFKHRRSIGTPYGIIGYRLGTPRLRIRKGYSHKLALECLALQLPEYVRTTREPAKAMLLAHRHTARVAGKLAQTGYEIVQDDQFYIDHAKPQALQRTA